MLDRNQTLDVYVRNKNRVLDILMKEDEDTREYEGILKIALSVVNENATIDKSTRHKIREFDTSKIHTIDDGDYHGTLLLIVPEKCYQPDSYVSFSVQYGSGSCCDILARALDVTDPIVKAEDLYRIGLHLLESMSMVGDKQCP